MSARSNHRLRRFARTSRAPLLSGICLLVVSLGSSEPAVAQSGAMNRATAEALFQQGVDLTKAQNFAEACEKFEGSLELDHALGNLLRLSDCYDRMGRTASAWGSFEELQALAEKSGDERRQRIAKLRSKELSARLSMVRINIEEPVPDQVSIRLDGMRVPSATLGEAFPVDPGSVLLEVSAPGFAAWSQTLRVEPGPSIQELTVPALDPAPLSVEGFGPEVAPQAVIQDEAGVPVLGYVLGAAGIAALTASAYFAFDAYSDNESSKNYCRPEDSHVCNETGVALREDAIRSANWSTITLAVGSVAALGAIGTVVWGESDAADGRDVQVSASASPWGAGCRIEGSF